MQPVPPTPPRRAAWLLSRLHPEDTLEEVQGDLEELYAGWLERYGKRKAGLRYGLAVLSVLPPFVRRRRPKKDSYSQPAYLHTDMIRNYLLVAWRQMVRHKAYSFLNVTGLAVGMAVALLIGLWVRYESGYDDFHANRDRVARVWKHTFYNNQKGSDPGMPLPLYDELKANYPEVERITRLREGHRHVLKAENAKVSRLGVEADPDFLHIFSFPAVSGNAARALTEPASIVLTESTARALFGGGNALGKIVRMDNQYDLLVTGVVRDIPLNSTLQFDFVVPFEHTIRANPGMSEARKTAWTNYFLGTVVQLREGASMKAFSAKISPILRRNSGDPRAAALFVHPLEKWHLQDRFENWENAGGRIDYVRLFGMVGLLVLSIACINFMNLTTARSEKRLREVGVRKAIGSGRGPLIVQFLSEAMLTAFLAFCLAGLLVFLARPLLATLGFRNVFSGLPVVPLLQAGLGICVVTGLLAGSYPALYLSSFAPVQVLKGSRPAGKGATATRKVLVVLQFTFSVSLIIGTLVVFKQVEHARSRPLGYDPDNLVAIDATDDLRKNYPVLKQELLNTGLVEAVTASSSPLTNTNNVWGDWDWPGRDHSQAVSLGGIMTEYDYEKTAGLTLLQGRGFSRHFASDSNAVLLNETAVRVMGFKEPLGQIIRAGDGSPRTVVGVVEDVVMDDPFKPVLPAVILFLPGWAVNVINLRLKPTADVRKTIGVIRSIVEGHNPAYPFEYHFVDEQFELKFKTETQAGQLAGVFAGLAVLISCLGLLGLAAYMAERRTKEIGIRKILGAPSAHLWALLSREFLVLVLLSCAIAIPLSAWGMAGWLQHYEYRTDLSWWIFGAAAAGALVITLLTISVEVMKVVLQSPVKSLRTE